MLDKVHNVSDLIRLAKTMDNDEELLTEISTDLIADDYDFALKVAKRIMSDLSASFKEATKSDIEDEDPEGVKIFTEIYVSLDSALKCVENLSI